MGSYTSELMEQLVRAGCEVTVVAPPLLKRPMGVARHIPVTPSRFDPTPGGWVSLSMAFRRLMGSEKELDPRNFDIFHFTDAREALCVPECLVPIVGTVHDCYAAQVQGNPFYYRRLYGDGFQRYAYYHLARSLERRAYRKVDCLLANSKYVADAINRTFDLVDRRVEVFHLGLTPGAEVKTLDLPLDGDPSILFVGSNFFRKGLPALARAAASLARSDFPQIKVHVVGKDRNQGEIEKLLQQLGIADRFVFHGWTDRSKTLELFPRATIACVPSLVEAFGLVYLEAMMAGTPVIAGSRGGAAEFIEHGKSGMLVTPDAPDEIAQCIKRISTDTELYSRLALNGKRVAQQFSGRRMGRETLRVYHSLLSKSRSLS